MAWNKDASVISGLGPATSTACFNDGTLKLISVLGSTYTGFYWNGSTWISDNSIITGISTAGTINKITVYNDGGTWKMLIGSHGASLPDGYYWNGATWILDANVRNGILPIGGGFPVCTPDVFDDAGTLKLIVYGVSINNGYYWDTSAWVPDSSIISGIDTVNMNLGTTMVFKDTIWKMVIGGESTISPLPDLKYSAGMVWNGSAWERDNTVNYGIDDILWPVFNEDGSFFCSHTRNKDHIEIFSQKTLRE